ncbi:uncharacterized protein L203_103411 [Cryptococcus depauperatus CBS 7841]|uniref:Cystinosin n=1 Tax=Cryptococcus depauperatus CBS 7841 TaxID=1295531 RepID=A0AAJ8M0P9_9TREE
MEAAHHSHPVASLLVGFCGAKEVSQAAWQTADQLSRTQGLSSDFIWVNPFGFLAITLWNWGAYFSPVARKEYQERHGGHDLQVSISDLAFSLHALIVSAFIVGQVLWYEHRKKASRLEGGERVVETSPLLSDGENSGSNPLAQYLPPDITVSHSASRPSLLVQIFLVVLVLSSFIYGAVVWAGKAQFLDWLYYVGNLKLVISTIKYVPQVILNHKLRAVEGFAIGAVLYDMAGSVLSLAQLVISSVYIGHDPSGIIANPAKLGLSNLTLVFDLIFLVQKYWLYRDEKRGDDYL